VGLGCGDDWLERFDWVPFVTCEEKRRRLLEQAVLKSKDKQHVRGKHEEYMKNLCQ
jgi:hypothetical protein